MSYFCKYTGWECEFANDRGYCVKTGCSKRITINEKPYVNKNLVEVVRCRDCKHYVVAHLKSDYTEDKRYSPSVCINGEFAKPRKPDWFCADGVRKEQEDDK